MTDLDQALVDIRNIRRQVARTTEFRGYGPFTLSATSAIALLAGAAQSHWIPEPATHPEQYVALWLTTGVLCAALIATQMLTRARRLHSGMADEMVRMAVTQFLPAGIAGAILPLVLLHITHSVFWMLPGLVANRLQPRRLCFLSMPAAAHASGGRMVPSHRPRLHGTRRRAGSRASYDVGCLCHWHAAGRCHPLFFRKEDLPR